MRGPRRWVVRDASVIAGIVALLALIGVSAAQAQSSTTITAAATVQFSGVVDSSTECTEPPTSVTITWGDGTSSAGTYDSTNNNVTGSHTFAAQETYTGSISFTGGTNCETDNLTANVGPAPLFKQCPPVYEDFGCQFLITVSDGGTTITQDTNQGPYEGADDALIGVVNNSSDPVDSMPLSTPGSDLFGFDEDGLCTPGGEPVPSGCVPQPGAPAATNCQTQNIQNALCSFWPPPPGEPAGYVEPGAPACTPQTSCPQNSYEGPTTWFSNVSADTTSGQVNFSPALQPGQSTYFSLEEPPSLAALNAGSTPTGATLSGAPTVTSTGAAFSGVINPNGSATTAYFQYGLDLRYSELGGSGPTYNQSTPVQSIGGDFADHSLSASVSGLVPNALYHVRLVATNKDGTTYGTDVTFMTTPLPPPGPPALGKSFDVKTVSGLVLIRLPGGHPAPDAARLRSNSLTLGMGFVPLTEARQLPTGTQVDARQGTIQLTAATSTKKHGKLQSGNFGGGIFSLAQDRSGINKGLTTLSLVEAAFKGAPSYASCNAKPAGDRPGPSASAARLSGKVLQSLSGSAHGKFRTRGRYAAATVRGTVWKISDRCDGTYIAVQRDTVTVQDFVRHITLIVSAHHSYLAKARK